MRLVPVPPNLYFEDFFETVTVEKDGKYVEESVKIPKNTNEKAVILLKVP